MSNKPVFSTEDIKKVTAKFDKILSKRPPSHYSSLDFHHDLSIIKQITKGKFSIYLISSKINNQKYAMKVFNYAGEEPHIYYTNEVRFVRLRHPNVINMVAHENEKETLYKGEFRKVSYILMEYAPHGDLFGFITNHHNQMDEKLARTYFRQLIDGIEYLHRNGVAHLDLKPENLLLDADFNLKVADFDLSYIFGDEKILSKGTYFYRGPEFFEQSPILASEFVELEDPFAADIYSAGIILFILLSRTYPHSEDRILDGICMADLMYENNFKFWKKHCQMQGREWSFFGHDFKELFNNMVKLDPKERLSIKQIKESEWYNGPVYAPVELQDKMKQFFTAN